jgi:hypothetical protein
MMPRRVLVMLVAVGLVACGNKPTPVAPTPPTASSEFFEGTLSVQGTQFYSFTVTTESAVNLTLGSLTTSLLGPALPTAMRIGLGVPSGTTCAVTQSQVVTPALAAQLTTTLEPSIYCVSLTDIGGLTADTDFVVRVTQVPTSITLPTGTDTTTTFASTLAVGGTATRTFTTTQGGTITVSLASLGGAEPDAVVGLGIGLLRTNSSCGLSQSIETSAGSSAQIMISADAGQYCVRIFDLGSLTEDSSFSMTIEHQ